MENDQRLVTLNDVAERANHDAEFFKAVVAHVTNPNAGLARYKMRLSTEDEDRLRTALVTINNIDLDFQQFGGWGRWPGFEF
jgi:hypothetical protein